MKMLLFCWVLLTGAFLSAAPQYEINFGSSSANGGIAVNEDLSSLVLHVDFGSVGNSASVGFYTYGGDVNDYTPGGKLFDRSGGAIDLGAVQAGTNIGFFLQRKNGDIITPFHFAKEGGSLFLVFDKNGAGGKDETLRISGIDAVGGSASGGGVSGQPLPGAIAAFLSGGAILVLSRFRRKVETR